MKSLFRLTPFVVLALFGGVQEVWAQFHQKGTLTCSRCHTIHDSDEGANMGTVGPQKRLLINTPIADLCLTCHDGNNAAPWDAVPDVYNVGAEPVLSAGDFNDAALDATKGHNPGGVLGNDLVPVNSPGGNFPAANLTCASCHDPHATWGTVSFQYRNLWKNVNAVDVSASILSANVDEATLLAGVANVAVSDTNHNIYKGSFGQWCAACHSNPDNAGTGFHGASKADADTGDGVDWIRHPTDTAIGATYAANYDIGVPGYKFAYPLIQVGGTWTTATVGTIAATDKVFCLSCHQAHASPFANAVRWDNLTATGLNAKCSRCHDK